MSAGQCRALSSKGKRCLRSAGFGADSCPMHQDPKFRRVSDDEDAKPNQCVGVSAKSGAPCKRQAKEGRDTCHMHSDEWAQRPKRGKRARSLLAQARAAVTDLPPPFEPSKELLSREAKGLRAVWDELCDRVASGEQMSYAAAQSLGFHRSALADYLRRDPNMVADLMAAEAVAAERVEAALYRRALDGDTRAASMWLGNRVPTRWSDIRRVEVSGNVQHEIEAGATIVNIMDLQARLLARQQDRLELEAPILDAEVLDES